MKKNTGAATAIYVRISFDPSGEGAGVERQRADCEELANQLGLTDLRLYNDNDKSAYSTKPRPDFERLLKDVQAGHINTVIVWAIDRLYRRLTDLERIVSVFDQADVPVHAVKSGDIDLSTADGRMYARMLATVAQHESEKKSERIVARCRQRATVEKITSTSACPFGWEFTDGGLQPHPVQAPALAAAYQDIIDGLTLHATWKRLAERVDVGKMTSTGLGSAMRRPRHAGLATYKGEIVGEAADGHKIVDVDTWRRATAILNDPSRKSSPGRPANTWLGGGLLRCGVCDGPMAASRKERVPVYICSREQHMTRRRAIVDPQALDMAAQVLAEFGAHGLLRQSDDNGDDVEHDLRVRITDAEKRLDELAALLAAGDLNPADFATATQKIRVGIEQDTEALTVRASRPALAHLAAGDDVAAAWQHYIDNEDTDSVRAVLAELLERITAHTDGSYTLAWAPWTTLQPSRIPPAHMPTAQRREKVLELHSDGLNINEIADALGVYRGTVRKDLTALRKDGKAA